MSYHDHDQRIDQLERALRRQRQFTTAVLAAAGCALACAFNSPAISPKPGVVQGSRFELIGPDGGIAAILSHDPGIGAQLVLNHKNGTPSCTLESTEDGGALFAMDRVGDVVASMGAQARGGSVYLHDASGENVCSIGAREDGGALFIKNSKGQEMCALGSSRDGGILHVKESSGASVVTLGSEEGDGFVRLNSDSGQATCILGSDETEGGFVKVLNAADKSVCDLGCNEQGDAYFFLRNKDEEVVMSGLVFDGDGVFCVSGNGESNLFNVSSGPDGGGTFTLHDRAGRIRLEATADSSDGAVTLTGADGTESVLEAGSSSGR